MIRALNKLQPYALFLVRLAVGFAMVYHSWDKVYTHEAFAAGHFLAPMQHFNQFVVHLGMPAWLGYVSTITEFVGGLCLLLGFLTRFWALMIAGNMLVALITVNRLHGYPGSEFTLALIAMSLLLLTTGSGALSLDRRFGIS
jgi:putative oxidoreductase